MPLWRDIPGYDGRYQVSPDGQVRSAGGTFTVPGRWGTMTQNVKPAILKLASYRGIGYEAVCLRRPNNGKRHARHLVHRLVAEAFVPNPQGLPQVNHIDGDRRNNKASNLEWVTASQNQIHRARVLKLGSRGEAHPNAKLTYEDVVQIRTSSETGPELARRYGVTKQNIYYIKRCKTWLSGA